MTQYMVAHVGTGYRVYATETGIDRHYIGPIHETPRAAGAYAAATPREEPRQSVSPAERDATSRTDVPVASAGTLRGAPFVGSEDAASGTPPPLVMPAAVPPAAGVHSDTLGLF
jgi:hypothetical protein